MSLFSTPAGSAFRSSKAPEKAGETGETRQETSISKEGRRKRERSLLTRLFSSRWSREKRSFKKKTLSLHYFPSSLSTPTSSKTSKNPRTNATAAKNVKDWNPPPVSDTKAGFYALYRKPLPAIYNVVLQELLVQAHLVKNNIDYAYDAVYALGLSSVLDAVLEGLEGAAGDKDAVFDAFVKSLGEDPARYRGDAAEMAKFAREGALTPSADGSFGQKALASVAARAASGELYYSRFLAVGVFRLLELSGAKDPKALEALAASLGVSQAAVARDLGTYKAVLSKLAAAKELMREMLDRERKKQAERLAEKAASQAKSGAESTSSGEEESVGANARAGEVLP